jgi:hypothetical protein
MGRGPIIYDERMAAVFLEIAPTQSQEVGRPYDPQHWFLRNEAIKSNDFGQFGSTESRFLAGTKRHRNILLIIEIVRL